MTEGARTIEYALGILLGLFVGFILCLVLTMVAPNMFMPEPDLVLTIEGVEISCFRDVVGEQ